MANPPTLKERSNSDANATGNTDSSAELAQVVDDLLNQLNTKFTTVSTELLAKMDDMSRRLDSLEATIQAGESAKGSGSGK